MITAKEGLAEAMIDAFVMEKGSYEFYVEASQKAFNAEAKKAFSQLAAWEKEHMQYVQFLYQALTEDRELLSFEGFKKSVRPETVEGAIPLDKLRARLEEYSFLDDLGAISMALEIEGKAYALYRRLSDEAGDPSVKAFMKDMMQWELKHIGYLRQLRYKLSETS